MGEFPPSKPTWRRTEGRKVSLHCRCINKSFPFPAICKCGKYRMLLRHMERSGVPHCAFGKNECRARMRIERPKGKETLWNLPVKFSRAGISFFLSFPGASDPNPDLRNLGDRISEALLLQVVLQKGGHVPLPNRRKAASREIRFLLLPSFFFFHFHSNLRSAFPLFL